MSEELHAPLACSSEPFMAPRAAPPSWLAPRPTSQPRHAWAAVETAGALDLVVDQRVRLDPSTSAEPAAPTVTGMASVAPPGGASVVPGSVALDPALPRPAALPSTRSEGEEALQAALAAVRDLAAQVTTEIAAARRAALEASERDLLRLAVAIAERIVEKEISRDAGLLARWVASGIDALTRDDDVRVVASPRVAALLVGAPGALRVDVDASFEGDRCEVRTRFGSVEVGLRARFETLVAELLGEETS